jgi:hypothetical protein
LSFGQAGKGALMRHFLILVAYMKILLLSLASVTSAQTAGSEWREIQYMSFIGSERIYDKSLGAVCERAYYFGASSIYYKGIYYRRAELRDPGDTLYANCVAKCPECTADDFQYMPAYRICSTFHMVDGVKTLKTFSYDAEDCEVPCEKCAQQAGNPVEVANFTKVTKALDWASPIEPRFKIERTYRSDSAFRARFKRDFDSIYDLFGNPWQRTYSDMIYWTDINPYDASDTRTWERYEAANGTAIYFDLNNTTQTIGGEGYALNKSVSGSSKYLTSPDGTIRAFYRPFSGGFSATNISWPDGYKISITIESNRYPIGMTDNMGNKADFLFNQNVVPGANRRMISGIVLSRATPSG